MLQFPSLKANHKQANYLFIRDCILSCLQAYKGNHIADNYKKFFILKFYPVGSIRNRFQVLSRQLVGGVQSMQPVTWCIFQTLFGKDRAGVLEHSNLLPIRR